MTVSGLPKVNGNLHSSEIALMSLALIAAVGNYRIKHLPEAKLLLRIGLHSGEPVKITIY